MNLFKLHTNPEQLLGYDQQYKMPENAWAKVDLHSRRRGSADKIKALEKYIKNGDFESYIYAREIIGGRWPPGEKAIANGNPFWAYKYAVEVLDERWPEGEETIFKDTWNRIKYKDHFDLPITQDDMDADTVA